MRIYVIDLHLSADQVESFYSGCVRWVWAKDRYGVSVKFPLACLRPYVGHAGISGRFERQVDTDHRLKRIRRLDSGRTRPI